MPNAPCPEVSRLRVSRLPCGHVFGYPCDAASAAAYGRLPEWPKGAVCKTVGSAYVGSNPTPATTCGNGPWLRKRARGAVFVLVTSRIRVCHCASRCRGVHGRIADGVRAGCAVGDTVGLPRTATDGPGKRGLVPAQVRCRCHAPPDGRHRPGRAGAAAAEGRAVRQTVTSDARGASGQLLYWRGCPSRTALTERDSPRPARRSRSERIAEYGFLLH
jgi:hypothetical protein